MEVENSEFDEVKCEKEISALENYHKEWNDALGTWRDHARHDHFSNGADAFRYLAISLKKVRTKEDDKADYKAAMAAFHESAHPLYDYSLPLRMLVEDRKNEQYP